jgi:hypothetical protein
MPIQLNCPKCPQRMEFVVTTNDGRFSVYRCRVHGEWHLGAGGVRAPGEILPPQELTDRLAMLSPGSGHEKRPIGRT